jgi:hypothetical protein
VTAVEAGRRLGGRWFPELFDGRHSFTPEQIGGAHPCAGPVTGSTPANKDGFRAMNDALGVRAERIPA